MSEQDCLEHLRHQPIEPFVEFDSEAESDLLDGLWRATAAMPDHVAVRSGTSSLTFAQFHRAVLDLAHHLHGLGVGAEDRVVVLIDRSANQLVAANAIHAAGAVYVPIDPNQPSLRLKALVSEIEPRVTIIDANTPPRLGQLQGKVVDLENAAIPASESAYPPAHEAQGHNLAYIVHTSGSTGKPKGVMNTRLGLQTRLGWMQKLFQLDGTDAIMQKTPLTFDVSVWECFWGPTTGATTVAVEPGAHLDSRHVADMVDRYGVTILHFVPSMLRRYLEALTVGSSLSLRHVLCSGESLPSGLQAKFFDAMSHARLHNLYGPAEAAIDVSHWECARDWPAEAPVPIGTATDGSQLHVVDENWDPADAGELLVGGLQLARGYFADPVETAKRFTPNHLSGPAGSRLYRTGDIVRRRPDSALEFVGRSDSQVKIGGVRIELGEIEATIASHPEVNAVVVGLDEYSTTPTIVATAISTVSARDLRNWLSARLPAAYTPQKILSIPIETVTRNGKLDRKALLRMHHDEDSDGALLL